MPAKEKERVENVSKIVRNRTFNEWYQKQNLPAKFMHMQDPVDMAKEPDKRSFIGASFVYKDGKIHIECPSACDRANEIGAQIKRCEEIIHSALEEEERAMPQDIKEHLEKQVQLEAEVNELSRQTDEKAAELKASLEKFETEIKQINEEAPQLDKFVVDLKTNSRSTQYTNAFNAVQKLMPSENIKKTAEAQNAVTKRIATNKERLKQIESEKKDLDVKLAELNKPIEEKKIALAAMKADEKVQKTIKTMEASILYLDNKIEGELEKAKGLFNDYGSEPIRVKKSSKAKN
jgi:chromosome segregation ATPase